MSSLLAALLAFSLLSVIQVVAWRMRKGGGHYLALSGLSVAVMIVALAAFVVLERAGHAAFLPATVIDYWNFVLLYSAMALAYMITYSAVQADSPTMVILLKIEDAGPSGCSRDELFIDLDDSILIVPRLNDLLIGDLVRIEGGRYRITHQGSLLARTYIAYRALLKMEKGG